MRSLTYYVKEGHKRNKNFFFTSEVSFPDVEKNRLVNTYPESLGDRRLWGLMGTFTDYMIRKMFRDGTVTKSAKVVPENPLIAELTMNHLEDLLRSTSIPEQVSSRIRNEGDDWISRYKSKSWEEVILDAFLMSQIDSLYRAGRISKIHELGPNEIAGIKEFMKNLESWLSKLFSRAQRVILNPFLGHPEVCKGDADIVVDDTIYEIKTVKRPREYIRKDKDQLLGYVALAFYHQQKPISISPNIDRLHSIGFLFPQSLLHTTTALENFSTTDKIVFIDRIQTLKSARLNYKPSVDDTKIESLIKAGKIDEAEKHLSAKVRDGETTLQEWHLFLERLGEYGFLDRMVIMSKMFEENLDNLADSVPVFSPEDVDWREDIPFQLYNIGTYLAFKGDPHYAKHCFKAYMESSVIPEADVYALLYLALIHKRLGENEKCTRQLNRARENMQPSDESLLTKIILIIDDLS